MKPENKQKMLTSEYIRIFTKALDNIMAYDEADKALELSRILEKALGDNNDLLRTRPEIDSFYKESLSKLKFICLPALPEKEVLDLFKKNVNLLLAIPEYDLLGKLKSKLINIDIVSERDKFKEELKKVISENGETITPSSPMKTIKDWLKDYLVKTGLDNQDNLKRAQYLSELRSIKTISKQEYQTLSLLFSFYDRLSMSSETPIGFEEEYPIIKDGKLFVFSKGSLEPVPEVKDYENVATLFSSQLAQQSSAAASDSVARDVLAEPIKTNPGAPLKPVPPAPVKLETSAKPEAPVKSEIPAQPLSRTQELEQSLKNYPSSSLEYKAIKQEINRLNKAAKKSDAQK